MPWPRAGPLTAPMIGLTPRLRAAEFNVTEVALEVGYASLSHFSAAFHETFGCCPGLYPLKTPTQKTN